MMRGERAAVVRILDISCKYIAACGLALATFLPPSAAHAQNYKVLYRFQGSDNGPDGAAPDGGLIADEAGNVYGVTLYGGTGCGTLFKLAQDGIETVLYAFKGGSDGCSPAGALIEDSAGNLYGTTSAGGGICPAIGGGNSVCGTIFRLAPDGTETVLYAFKGESDGWAPSGGLLSDKHGNLYGATEAGGNYTDACGMSGCGTVFKLAPHGKKTILHNFTGDADGESPVAPLIADKAGDLYGMTYGPNPVTCEVDCGTVFKIAPDGTETVLYDFCHLMYCADGSGPAGGLLADSAGNLYGTTSDAGFEGNVFMLAPDGTETVLHHFQGPDGAEPAGSLISDRQGNLYGATYIGGSGCGRFVGCGTIFKLAPDGTETVLYGFQKKNGDGHGPNGGLISINGYLYGTTLSGGGNINCGVNRKGIPYGCGTVFTLKE
jgi:uncharacterized repeat protein (TIGR03803 family)